MVMLELCAVLVLLKITEPDPEIAGMLMAAVPAEAELLKLMISLPPDMLRMALAAVAELMKLMVSLGPPSVRVGVLAVLFTTPVPLMM